MAKAASVEQYKLVTSFESVRRALLDANDNGRLEKPLAYWALPNDRRLPLALLDQTLRDLLDRPFDELSSTPGIGQKKMGAMIKLLLRAANEPEHEVPFGIPDLADSEEEDEFRVVTETGFDPAVASEPQWTRWKQTVVRHGVESEKLGRFAVSLQHLPTVIWERPLGYYTKYTIAEIRRLKTHGEKRVTAILEVFHDIDRVLSDVPTQGPIAVRLMPRFAERLESWTSDTLASDGLPAASDLRKNLISPLLKQTKHDLGETVFKLCEGRIGGRSRPQSVKALSRRLGVTRARVYQLLDDCAKAFAVRWPEGDCLLLSLQRAYSEQAPDSDVCGLINNARAVLFPEKPASAEEA